MGKSQQSKGFGQRHHLRPICRASGKRAYRSKEGALASTAFYPAGVELYAYQCPFCSKWHLTRNPQ